MSRFYQPYFAASNAAQMRRNNNANLLKQQYDDVSDSPLDYNNYYEQQQHDSVGSIRARNSRKNAMPVASAAAAMPMQQRFGQKIEEPKIAGGVGFAVGASVSSSLTAFGNIMGALSGMEFTLTCDLLLQYLSYSLCLFMLIIWLFPENILFILLGILLVFLSIVRHVIRNKQTQRMNVAANAKSTRTYNSTKLEQLRAQLNKRQQKNIVHTKATIHTEPKQHNDDEIVSEPKYKNHSNTADDVNDDENDNNNDE